MHAGQVIVLQIALSKTRPKENGPRFQSFQQDLIVLFCSSDSLQRQLCVDDKQVGAQTISVQLTPLLTSVPAWLVIRYLAFDVVARI